MRIPPPKSRKPRHDRSGGTPPEGRRTGAQPQHPTPRHPTPAHRADTRSAIPSPSVARHLLLYGVHPVEAAWLNPERRCLHLYATEDALAQMTPTLERAAAAGLRRPQPIPTDRETLDRLLPQGAVHQGLALDAEPLPEVNLDDMLIAVGDEPATLVLLDQVTDPHNVGAILRSAAAFGVRGMIVQRRHAPEVTGVLAKSASGAVEIVPILRETNLARSLAALRDAGFVAIGLAERGETPIGEAATGSRTVLVLGAEGSGLRRLVAEGCNQLVRLPTRPPIASLNVSNAAAVALYEIARRRAG